MHLNLFEILFEQVYVPSRIKGLCHNYKLRETFLKILRPKVKQQSFIIRSAISFRELETAPQPGNPPPQTQNHGKPKLKLRNKKLSEF